jgi:3-oxoadipate enol-lactonase
MIAPDLRNFGPRPQMNADERPRMNADQPGPRMNADQRGSETGSDLTVDDLASDVLALLDRLEIEQAVIGGLSMGGYVTFAMYRRAPERFHGMVLADTRSQADTEEIRHGRLKMIATARERGAPAIADEMIPKLLGETSLRERADLQLRVREMIEENGTEAIVDGLTAMLARPDSTPDLHAISCATLVIVGAEDMPTPPADSERMQAKIPRSRLVLLPLAGHLSNVEAPDLFSKALVDFLTSFI